MPHALNVVPSLLLAAALCAQAQAAAPGATEAIDLRVVDRSTGQELPVYWHDGERWVAGTPGHRYSVRLQSRRGERLLGVISVDGINALTGETAGWDQRGYVLAPFESTEILGWRKSPDRVADFVFTALPDSYAARTGRPQDVGVIGIAVFREAPPLAVSAAPPQAPASALDSPAPQPAPAESAGEAARRAGPLAIAPAQQLGTGHGPAEISHVWVTQFERASDTPEAVVSIRYDRRDRLVAMGVIPAERHPRPFPQSADAGYVADPPGRGW